MKKNIILFLLPAMVQFAGCERDTTKNFLSGTFINSATGAFSIAEDTLIIEAAQSNNFHITRRTGFNLIRKGKLGKRQYQMQRWQALYNEQSKALMETTKGRIMIIYPDSGYLMIGRRKYIKN